MSSVFDHESIKALAKETGRRVTGLLALAPRNDPFYSGAPASRALAEWFADAWERAGMKAAFATGASSHLRRLHYRLLGSPGPDGMPYENTALVWQRMQDASKYARHLGLVPYQAIEDHRNDAAIVNAPTEPAEHGEPVLELDWPDPAVPAIRLGREGAVSEEEAGVKDPDGRPTVLVYGYDYAAADQPYLLEIFIEKTTMNDVLVPLCAELGVNLVTASGGQSITHAAEALERAKRLGKPLRIFFISDFDPAGDSMPVATARHVEFINQKPGYRLDVGLVHLALTAEQVAELDLPRVPVKDSDRRKASFEERRGEGGVELDALEALHPGSLVRIVRDAIEPYLDDTLETRLDEAGDEAWEAGALRLEELGPKKGGLDELIAEREKVLEAFGARISELQGELASALRPVNAKIKRLRKRVLAEWNAGELAIPPRPEPDPDVSEADEAEYLLRSDRSYEEQLDSYREHRGGELEEETG